jgi:5-methylcytosine-specific restriction endonuclease McrA
MLLERDGPSCWLCNRTLSMQATNPGKRITLEHLTPRSAGGDDRLANLVLCHAACNRHLRDHPAEKKIRIRAKWHRETARVLRRCEVSL